VRTVGVFPGFGNGIPESTGNPAAVSDLGPRAWVADRVGVTVAPARIARFEVTRIKPEL